MVNLTYQSFLHREITKEENKIANKQFAMYVKENDEYVEYKDNLFPKNYYVNKSLSKCVDEKGNPVENVISSLGNNVTITSNKTVYCTLYFDKNEMLEYLRSKDTNGVLSADIVGDMYRYQGVSEEYASDELKVVDNNYICLGEDCSEYGEDLYRIIGVTETGELKVIKKTALPETYPWHAIYGPNDVVNWPNSDIFNRLNDYSGSSYSSNTYDTTSFYSNLDEKLKKYILKKDWLYGETSESEYDGNKIYAIESGKEQTKHYVKNKDDNESTEVTYKWTESVSAYIGLQYMHDYLYAYPGGNTNNGLYLSKTWIFLKNNENMEISDWFELLIPITGYYAHLYYPRAINYGGGISDSYHQVAYRSSVRPVFYLTSNLSLIGEGTLSEPFEIDYEKTGVDIINSKPANLSAEETGGMYRFQGNYENVNNNYICFGTNDRDECLNNQDTYMYRIIGITKDGKIKLIKKTGLDKLMRFGNNNQDIKWPESEIYKNINGNDFLNNEKYIPQNSEINWLQKIEDTEWLYGDIMTNNKGMNQSGSAVYQIEAGLKETEWWQYEEPDGVDGTTNANGEIIHCSKPPYTNVEITCYSIGTGKWTQKELAKIGLMYISDYYLAVNDNANCYIWNNNFEECLNSWIHLSNNAELDNGGEYFMTRFGWQREYNYFAGYSIAIGGNNLGSVWNPSMAANLIVRPVFFLNKDVVLKGKGTLKYPYIVKE